MAGKCKVTVSLPKSAADMIAADPDSFKTYMQELGIPVEALITRTMTRHNTQLIVVKPDGTIEAIRSKRDKGLDLREVGGVYTVRRISEIVWEDALGGYVINLLPDEGDPGPLRIDDLHEAGLSYSWAKEFVLERGGSCASALGVMFFSDYDDAVAVEVEYLDAAKRLGVGPKW